MKTDHVDMMPDDEIVPPLAPGPSSAALAGEVLSRAHIKLRVHERDAGVRQGHIGEDAVDIGIGRRLDQLPDAVFVRALASSVCRTLKMDPGPVLAQLPQNSGPRLAHDENGINAPFRSPDDNAGASWMTQLSRPAILLGLAFLLAAWLGWLLLPVTIWCVAFFRDPERKTPQEPGLIICPADGKLLPAVDGASRSRSTVKPVAAPEAPLANTKAVSPAPVIAPPPPTLQAPPQPPPAIPAPASLRRPAAGTACAGR